MSILYLAGREANAIEGAELITVSSEDALFTKERAYDRFPGSSFKFNVPAANDIYDISIQRLLNGGFENWDVPTVPNSWDDESNGTGVLSKELALFVEGAAALKLVGGGGGNEASTKADMQVLSGWTCNIDGRLRGDAANPTTTVIQCLETGEYLTPAGGWQAAPINFISQTLAAYTGSNVVNFLVRPFSITRRHLVTLRVTILTATGTGYADAFRIWPDIDFCSIHGHNLGSNIVMKIQSDNDPAYGSVTSQTMAVVRPTFFLTFPKSSERFWRFLSEGTNFEAGKFGELVLGQYKTMSLDFQPGSEVSFQQPRETLEAANTQMQVINLSDDPVREYSLEFAAITEAQKNEIRDQILLRSRHGKDYLIVVPDTNNTDVIYGRFIDEDWSYVRSPMGSEAKGSYVYSIRVREDPLDLEIG